MLWGPHVFSNQTWPRVNTTQKQYGKLPMLVTSKGHCVKEVPELPFVVEDKIESYEKTKEAVWLLKKRKA